MHMSQVHELINLEGIVKRYGSLTALDNVSLNINEGEFLALLGPSGCGKTSLLATIAGFLRPDKGDVKIDGVSVIHRPPNKRPVNTVFQNYALFPHLTVFENVAFGPRRHKINKSKIKHLVTESLEMVGMESMMARYPSELSGGQQQRVALARAIVNRPRVLLLDEPMAALDLKLRKRMQIELKRLQEHLGITFIIVTHDQEEALVMADRIAVMNSGKIMQVGTGKEIYNNPANRFVADFIGEANLIDCYATSNGKIQTDKLGIELPYRTDQPHKTKITLMLRPECFVIEPNINADDYIHTKGIVREITYAGSISRAYIDCEISNEIIVTQNSAQLADSLIPNQKIHLGWRTKDARILIN